MDHVMSPDDAKKLLDETLDLFETEIDSDSEKVILKAIESGRLEIDLENESFLIRLKHSIELKNGETLSKLEIVEPTFAQIKKASGTEIEQVLCIISTVTGQPQGVIERMKMKDMTLCGTVLGFFS